jgi:large subunit ribosomal protein L10
MSKAVKELIQKELVQRFDGVESLAVIGFTGIDAITTHRIRSRLVAKDMRMTVVKNSVARQAFSAVGLESARELLDGPCAVVYGGESVVNVVRELLEIKKDAPALTVKAALLDGEPFGAERIKELSEFPTRDEALSKAVQVVLSPGAKLVGCIVGPGSKIASLLKALQEKKEDEGEGAEAPQAEAPEAEAPQAEASQDDAAPEATESPAE